jgi:hypothetical protein
MTSFLLMSLNIAYPVLTAPRRDAIDRVEVSVDGGDSKPLFLLEDMGRVIAETFRSQQNLIVERAYIRAVSKLVTSLVAYAGAEYAVSQIKDSVARLAALITLTASKVAVNAALEVSERADTRMARYLPNRAFVGGVTLPPGRHEVVLRYYSRGYLFGAPERRVVTVRAGEPNILEAVNLH